jgi:glycosyltransferase involved in cell wall biosynthesis
VPRVRRVIHAVRSDAFAGVERYIVEVTNELVRRGTEVAVIGGDPTSMRAHLPAATEWRAAATTRAVGRALRDMAPADIVHVHMTAAELAALVLPRRTAVVATRHFAGSRGSGPAAPLLRRAIERRLTAEIAISDFVARSCNTTPVVLHNGTPEVPPSAGTEPLVVVIQRLQPEKRTADALRIWERSGLHEHGWRLAIAGGGSQAEALADEVRRREIPAVELLGHLQHPGELHQRARLALATAPAEPFGLSVVEMMAAGLPVVACGGGGHLETIGRAAPELTYRPGDLEAAAELLRATALDDQCRAELAARIRAHHHDHLTIERHVDELLRVYDDALAAGRGRS